MKMKKSLVLTVVASVTVAEGGDDRQREQQPRCSLYLAPSVPGINADGVGAGGGGINMGVFAGVDYPPGSVVGNPDIVVPIVDVRAQIGTRKNRFSKAASEGDGAAEGEGEGEHEHEHEHEHHSFDWHWSDYVWEPRAILGPSGAGGAEGVSDSKAAAHGLGSLVRGGGETVEPNVVPARAEYDSAGLHRSRDPNAGGISYYHGMKTVATRPIEAGEELFSDFGMHYFADREGEEFAAAEAGSGADPDARDGDEKYQALVDGTGDNLDDGGAQGGGKGLWGMLWDNKGAFKRVLPQVIGGATVGGGMAVGTASPGAASSSGKEGNHSTEWLTTHGYCLDNIVPGPSKVPRAGRGAFASRPIVAGAVIAPAPVVHLPDRDVLDMRAPRSDHHNADTYRELMTDEVTGKQLLLNYCFGHSESTMLLCPVGSVTGLINHAQSGVSEPNAEIRWSNSANMSNATWLNMTLDQLDDERRIGLVLEYVALRDIRPGEEILIDYGREWEEAWNSHVEGWTKTEGSDLYTAAADLNQMYRNSPIRTLEEQVDEPYPVNVETSCYYDYVPDAGLAQPLDEDDESSGVRVSMRRWLHGMDEVGTNLRPCRILKRDDAGDDETESAAGGGELYTARILNPPESQHHRDARIPDDERVLVTNIPRNAVVLTDRPYTTDVHLPNAFRHEMMVPDGIFPDAWRNNL